MSEHPKMLYRPHESGPVHDVWGHKCSLLVVDGPEAEALALDNGWSVSPPPEGSANGWSGGQTVSSARSRLGLGATSEFSLLDQSAVKIAEALPALSADELRTLLDAEKAGKTRKGVIKMIEDALTAERG